MKTASNVVPNYGPVYAAALYPDLARLCISHGYALAVHGSLARDFDVVAIPWDEPLSEPQVVLDAITGAFAVRIVGGPYRRFSGRVAYALSIGHGECAVDFSFAPRGSHANEATIATLREQLQAAQAVPPLPEGWAHDVFNKWLYFRNVVGTTDDDKFIVKREQQTITLKADGRVFFDCCCLFNPSDLITVLRHAQAAHERLREQAHPTPAQEGK